FAALVRLEIARAESHPFTVHDLVGMDRLDDPQVSPDGHWIVFSVRVTDLAANKGLTDLWLINVDGTALRRLTSNPASDGNARWTPDGKSILFVSSRSGSSQVWRIAVDGGEAEQITKEPLDVGNLVVSPKGTQIAYTMEVFPDSKGPADTKKRLDEVE